MSVRSICGIILASANPKALAEFYGAALGLSFEREEHGDLEVHFGIDIGKVHFGIHPPENFKQDSVGNSATSIAFNVDSLEQVCSRIKQLGIH